MKLKINHLDILRILSLTFDAFQSGNLLPSHLTQLFALRIVYRHNSFALPQIIDIDPLYVLIIVFSLKIDSAYLQSLLITLSWTQSACPVNFYLEIVGFRMVRGQYTH